jgi:hypothetical protein
MREVAVSNVAYTLHTGTMVAGKWHPDGGTEPMSEIETAYRMISSTSRVEYPRTFVAEAVDVGTETDRHQATPAPAPAPWNDCDRGRITTHKGAGKPEYAADVETYRAALAEYYGG